MIDRNDALLALADEIAAYIESARQMPIQIPRTLAKDWEQKLRALASAPAQSVVHPASTHCDNCGCDWLDNGLNPIGCPYCKQTDAELLQEARMVLDMTRTNAEVRAGKPRRAWDGNFVAAETDRIIGAIDAATARQKEQHHE